MTDILALVLNASWQAQLIAGLCLAVVGSILIVSGGGVCVDVAEWLDEEDRP